MSQATTLAPDSISVAEPEIDRSCEVVNGQVVEKPPAGSFQVILASLLVEKMAPHARVQGLGRVVSEMLFQLDATGTLERKPDLAFVSRERWPRGRKINSEDGWDVIPELAVEVISPSNKADEVIRKIREYFEAGMVRVWVVYPGDRLVYLDESPRKNIILGEGDDLDGGDLLPGLRPSLAELFEDAE